ncbi:MAG: tRNA (guanosine(37)-N1)-methyltransferase TrmD [Ignavibacteria bacterium]|nr:tRNA (guanosine(37)-N1)-methyltransferase TrmD [Ignavibacteria bacterium]
MRIDILTGFPALFQGPLTESIVRRAQAAGQVEIVVHDLRDHAHDRHRTIDDSPYGGGAGMILKPEPIFECVDMLIAERPYDEVILTTPKGALWTQSEANRMSMRDAVIIICGHYKGVDERVRQALVTREISIGDVVLTGGELVAMVIVDTVVRLIPGVIGDGESLLSDSFMDGRLDCPYYTRPPEYRGLTVPEALQSGDHKAIAAWRDTEAMRVTRERRPDLLRNDDRPPGTNEK